MVTLRDVARECGLSLPTVSQVFGSRSKLFSEETRQKVFETARRLGYRRHTGATNLATGRTNTLYVVMQGMNRLATSTRIDSFMGFTEAAEERLQQLSISCFSSKSMFEAPTFKRIMNERICDGVIFNAVMPEDEMDRLESLFAKVDVPLVWLNVAKPLNAVYPDEELAAERIARRILERGFDSVLYVGVPLRGHFSTELRPKALEESFLRLGGKSFQSIDAWGGPEAFRKSSRAFFKKPFDGALVFYSDGNLLSFAKAAQEAGRSLHEYPFAVFDGPADYSDHTVRVRIDAAAPDFRSLGRKAVEALMDRIDGGGTEIPSIPLPPVEFFGDTLGKKGASHE